MALKLIDHARNTTEGHLAKVYWDDEWEEYRVKFYRFGEEYTGCDYHTDDLDDAKTTARHWAFCG